MAQGVPGRLRPRIFLTFGTTRVADRQPYAPAAFTPGEIPGTHFQGLSRPQRTWFRRREPWKKSPVTPPGIDRGTVRLVAQCLNHYATPGPTRALTVTISSVLKVAGFISDRHLVHYRVTKSMGLQQVSIRQTIAYNGTLRTVRAAIAAVEMRKILHILSVCLQP